MLPGERISLIKSVAASLVEEENATDLNLTLRAFGFPTEVGDYGDELSHYEYVVRQLEAGRDDALIALRDHLYPGVGSGPRDEADAAGPWQGEHFRLFVSHTSAHREFAGGLRRSLLALAVDCFVAHDQIEPTREWQDEIETALNTCDALVAVFTPRLRGKQVV